MVEDKLQETQVDIIGKTELSNQMDVKPLNIAKLTLMPADDTIVTIEEGCHRVPMQLKDIIA